MVARDKAPQQGGVQKMLSNLIVGNMAYLGAQFLAFMALTQWGSIEEVGRFSWALALTSPVFILADMRTRQIQLSTSADEFNYQAFLFQRLLMQVISVAIAILLGISFSPDRDTLTLVTCLSMLKLVEGIMNVSIGEYMRIEETDKVALIQVVRAFFYGVPFILATFLTSDATIAVLAAFVGIFVPMVLGHFLLPKEVRTFSFNFLQVRDLTKQAWPLGIGFFIGSVTVNGPRFLVEEFHGVVALASFTAVAYVIVLANTVVDSITQGLMPRFTKYWKTHAADLAMSMMLRICFIVISLGMVGILISVIAGSSLLSLLYGEEYSAGQPILIALFVYATIQYLSSTLRSVLIAGGIRTGVLWTSSLNLIVTISLSFLWVPEGGPESAGWALALGQGVQLGIYIGFVFYLFRKTESEGRA